MKFYVFSENGHLRILSKERYNQIHSEGEHAITEIEIEDIESVGTDHYRIGKWYTYLHARARDRIMEGKKIKLKKIEIYGYDEEGKPFNVEFAEIRRSLPMMTGR